MPFCPKCRAEYETGFAKCADCEVPLVSRLPEPKQAEIESAVVYLCTVNNEIETILLRDLLQQAGIESSCQEKTFTQYPNMLYPNYTSIGINDIMVLDKDYNAARQIAEDYFKSLKSKPSSTPEDSESEESDK